ncbi:NADPH-dependent diflavin oxidoreductase 1 isoform X2 [Sitophilus oryzae]|uniref:NADPH-dependent diflavin oxidoreductase 1 n=1 Tax=Sitophilus oryzae TaxID=7048 RepID=A0A6J2X4P2_SITOR|nr:NADPH-dependent diflavin oxidoreductase 1 isoform X2 [Sitophilus oryzae]
MFFLNKKITILYGSQTGNAQDLAERIWRESKRFYFQSSVSTLNEYDVSQIAQENCLIIVCSTTGQGDEPENMKKFWKLLLRRSLPSDLLSDVRFAILGLGDSSYTKFNFVAKRLYKRILNLGGEPILPIGLADDQHDLGYDAIADPWIENLWLKLTETYPLPHGIEPLPKNLPILPRWNIEKDGKLLKINNINKNHSLYYSTRANNEFCTVVLDNVRQTDLHHFQDVRLIKFQCDFQEYKPGDLLVLRPRNLVWKINEFKSVLEENGVDIPDHTIIKLIENNQKVPVPEVLKAEVTFQQLCEEYFDLFSIPRRTVFQVLSQITDSELEREKCLEFTSAEGQEEMYSYTNRPKRNIVEVLRDFPHATKNITLETLFEIIPSIKPREFSIASSFKVHKHELHLLVAVVKYKTNLIKERFGLCSNFLSDLISGDRISVWLKPGFFKFPKDLVSPGTGVAPFRSYIYEMTAGECSPENLILFYGSRYKDKDFIIKDDVEKWVNKVSVICAFSREQEHKIYVQDKIREHGELVWRALEKKGYVFIAGNSKNMPQAVRESFINVCEKWGNLSNTEAVRFIEVMEKENRYQTECWS